MAIFRREASVARPILFLYFLLNILFVNNVNALDSNKLVLHWNDPSQVFDAEAGSLSFTNVPNSMSLRSSAGNIKLQDIPQVISLALGFSSLQNIDWSGLSAGNIFNRPKANILFVIDGVSKGNTIAFSEKSPTYTIIKNKANANLDVFRISPLRNFVSHISSILKDKPLVVSFSAQKQLAKAASTTGRNAYTVTWDGEERTFKDEANSNEMKLSKDELLKMFKAADFGEGVKYIEKEHKFVVSTPGMKDVSFDMNEMDNFLFFAEIQTLFYLYEKIKSFDSLIHDDFVDFFTFGISTVKGLSRRHGNASHQVAAAMHILNNVIPQITKLFNELYGGQALVEVVNLEKKEKDGDKMFPNEVNDVYEHVQDHLRSPSRQNFNEDLPEVNLKEDLEKHAVSEICQSVRNKLVSMQSEMQVSCINTDDDVQSHMRVRRDIPAERKKAGCDDNKRNLAIVDDYYDDEFPPIFNIVLWLMIILVLAVYVVAIVMWYMDPGRDSVIYRVTSQRIKSE